MTAYAESRTGGAINNTREPLPLLSREFQSALIEKETKIRMIMSLPEFLENLLRYERFLDDTSWNDRNLGLENKHDLVLTTPDQTDLMTPLRMMF